MVAQGVALMETEIGWWFAAFTAALMLGAAVGGSLLGNLGDRIGRSRAMGISMLFYSLFAGLGAFVATDLSRAGIFDAMSSRSAVLRLLASVSR